MSWIFFAICITAVLSGSSTTPSVQPTATDLTNTGYTAHATSITRTTTLSTTTTRTVHALTTTVIPQTTVLTTKPTISSTKYQSTLKTHSALTDITKQPTTKIQKSTSTTEKSLSTTENSTPTSQHSIPTSQNSTQTSQNSIQTTQTQTSTSATQTPTTTNKTDGQVSSILTTGRSRTSSTERYEFGSSTESTTQSTLPWRGISFGLAGLSVVLLITCVVTCIVICKMKRMVLKVNRTLYIGDEEHVYQDLTIGKKKSKKEIKVELKSIHKTEDEVEVIDSPMFSPSPPSFPTDDPPSTVAPIPPSKPPPRKKTSSNQSADKRTVIGAKFENTNTENVVFYENEVAVEGADSTTKRSVDLYDDDNNDSDNDSVYEPYSHQDKASKPDEKASGKTCTLNVDISTSGQRPGTLDESGNPEVFSIDDLTAYEEPVKSPDNEHRNDMIAAAEMLMEQTKSNSGLPDISIQRTDSTELSNTAPLTYIDDDASTKTVDDGQMSGLPNTPSFPTMDDLQNYDNVEFYSTKDNKDGVGVPDLVTINTANVVLGDLSLYDDGDFVEVTDKDKIDDDLPIYEDFDKDNSFMTHNSSDQANTVSPKENCSHVQNTVPVSNEMHETTHDETFRELETVTASQAFDVAEGEHNTESEQDDRHRLQLSTPADPLQKLTDISLMLPKVPPRRDLVTTNTQPTNNSLMDNLEPSNITSDSGHHSQLLTAVSDPGQRSDIHGIPHGVMLRTRSESLQPRESYFLDMDDSQIELNVVEDKRMSGSNFDAALNTHAIPELTREHFISNDEIGQKTITNKPLFPSYVDVQSPLLVKETRGLNGGLLTGIPVTNGNLVNIELNGQINIDQDSTQGGDIYDIPSRYHRKET